MRAPPPVEFTSTSSRAGRAALAAFVGLVAAVLVAWALPHAVAQWGDPPRASALLQGGMVLAVAIMTTGAFWLERRRSDVGERTLRWDGQDWILVAADGMPRRGDATLMLDLGPWMLVRFQPAAPAGAGAAAWLGLTIGADASRWAALRGALWNWRAARGDARP